MLLVCYGLLNSHQSIPFTKRLVTRTPLMQLKKLQKLHRKRSNNWPLVSFIHNGSETTTWMGYSLNTKSTKYKDKNMFFEFQAASCRSLDQHKDTGGVHQLTKTAIFKVKPMKKHIQQFILPQSVFCQFVDRKVVGLMPKYYLLAGDTSQVSIFS